MKKVEQPGVETYELEPEQPIDISDAAFDDINASIARVEAMKRSAADSIVKAKEKGLVEHTERFRVLLRKLVIMDNELKAEKERKEKARLAADLDRLEAEFTGEIYEYEKDNIEEYPVSEYELKSIRHGVAAKLFGLVGTFACMLGCVIYLILTLTTISVPFEWVWVIADAAMLVVFAIIGICLSRSSASYARLAEEEEYERMLEEEAMEEMKAAEASEIAAQAYALEQESAEAAVCPSKRCLMEKLRKMTKGAKKEKSKTDAKVDPKVVVPAVAAGVAVLAVAAASGSKKAKAKKKKKAPRLQGVILEWD